MRRKGALSMDSALVPRLKVVDRLVLQPTLPPPSISAPASNRSWMLRLFCSHSASRYSSSFRTSSSIFRVLIKLLHSFFEIVRSRRGNVRTLLFGMLLPIPAGQRLKNRLKRRGAGRIVPVTKNVQENLDTFSLMWVGGKQVVAAGTCMFRHTRTGRLRMRNPEGKGFRDRLFVGEAALGSFSLKLPVQICRQPNSRFNSIPGAHKIRSSKLLIFLRLASPGACAVGSRVMAQPESPSRWICSNIRTDVFPYFMFFIKPARAMQEFCSEFRTEDFGAP